MFRSIKMFLEEDIENDGSAIDIKAFHYMLKRVEFISGRITPSSKMSLSMFEFIDNFDSWEVLALPNTESEMLVFDSVLRFNEFVSEYLQHSKVNLKNIDVVGYPYNINGEGILFVAGDEETRADLLQKIVQGFDSLVLDMLLDGTFQLIDKKGDVNTSER